jgi:uncharacterized protein
MKMQSARFVPAPQDAVWAKLNDPQVLMACVPGCEAMDLIGENQYASKVVARIGPVAATFKSKISMTDIVPPTSYKLSFNGDGGVAGFGKGSADVSLAPHTENGVPGTQLSYDVQAQIGGKLAQIGSRLVDGAAAKMADDFFERFVAQFPAPEVPAAAAAAPAAAAKTPGGLSSFFAWLRRLFGAKS